MKIDIVTPYGNNKFDLGVNEVAALIQKAYEYSEKKSKEEPESEEIAETLQEAVAEAWGVVGDKERERVRLEKEHGETADIGAQKPRKKSRNDSLFGEGWKEAIHNGYEQKEYDHNTEGYKGFLYIKCPVCGKEKGFCAKSSITEHKCECGHKTRLENLKPMYVHCDRGEDFKYFTNMEEETFNYKCFNCGDIVKIRINKRETAYVTARENLAGGGTDIYRKYGMRTECYGRSY